jgi:hypothetical protein
MIDLVQDGGLKVAVLSLDGLEHQRSDIPDDVDVLRVPQPPPHSWEYFRATGFSITSSWVTWIAPACGDEEEFLAGLSAAGRRNVRAAQRTVLRRGIKIEVDDPLPPARLDEFLELYGQRIAALPRGVAIATESRGEILAHRDKFLVVHARDPKGLAAACICEIDSKSATLYVRFSAATTLGMSSGLVRALYMTAFQTGRERGCKTVSLGSDPSLYGGITKPGLFTFKTSLGFTPVATHDLLPGDISEDSAEMIVKIDRLANPSLLLAYPTNSTVDRPRIMTRLEIFTASADRDLSRYDAAFVAERNVVVLPG